MTYADPDAFFAAIDAQYSGLSKRLQSIARDLPQFRERIALGNVQDLAAALGVSAATVVRFAQHFGFSGYSDMKALFQQDLAAQLPPNSYAMRIQRLVQDGDLNDAHVAEQVILNNMLSLQNLLSPELLQQLETAAKMMQQAKALFVMAAGRSFAAAAYMTYLLQHAATPLHWLNGLCFNLEGKLHSMGAGDVLLLISFAPYAESSIQAARGASARGAKVIAITDSHLGEIAQHSDALILVRDPGSYGFRSLVGTMSVLQALFLLYAAQRQLQSPEAMP